jgi:hypothetical protein
MRLATLLLALLSPAAWADVLSVVWTYPDPPAVPIVGFHVWCGNSPGVYDQGAVAAVGASERSAQISIGQSDKRYCAVTAYNEAADSLYSNEVVLVSKPNAPIDFAISGMAPNTAGAPPPPPGSAPQAVKPGGVRAVPLPAPR